MNWLISSNINIFKCREAFADRDLIDWRQSANYEVGDIIFIYLTRPLSRVQFKCIVEDINIEFEDIIDDREFWVNKDEYAKTKKGLYSRLRLLDTTDGEELTLNKLKKNGLKAAPQGPIKLKDELLSYIEKHFNNDITDSLYPEEILNYEELYEGTGRKIIVNSYERNSIARKKCIEYHGTNCIVCDFKFRDIYGKFAEDFIHVHHIVPLSEINKEYIIDYKRDLVPVCPNCHAMLHRIKDSNYLTVDELREIVRNNNRVLI